MGEVYSHLSEEERQVIQIEAGNGASIRGIGAMPGRSPSSISREIKRNTWFPSNENEPYRPYRPKRPKAGPWTGRHHIAGPAQRKADRRRSKPRKPYRLSHDRLWARVAEWLGCGWAVGQFSTDWPSFMTITVLALLPVFVFFIFCQKWIVSGLVAGSVKG